MKCRPEHSHRLEREQSEWQNTVCAHCFSLTSTMTELLIKVHLRTDFTLSPNLLGQNVHANVKNTNV